MRVTRTQSKRLLAILPIFVCIFLAACLPMKVPKQVQPVTGGILKSDPDISAIRVGLTTRAEIIQQFGDFDAGWKGERLFFGRWLRSGGVAVVGMYSDFNYTGRGWWIAHDLVI